jgi:coproporphyrinogen III oxidase-like Fe-S oxidoreductase
VGPHEILNRIARKVSGSTRDLQIYIHIPFCSSKCLFCDWVVEVPTTQLLGGREARSQYVDRLCQQISFYGPHLTDLGYRPKFIYWGGGTPTRLDASDLERIIASLHESFDLSALAQHTLETTPNDLTAEKADRLKSCGVDRVSVGVQSFNAQQLRTSGRSHSAHDAVRSLEILRTAGIHNINIDLISGFPGERREWFEDSLRATVDLAPTHVTVYSYRATPQTRMAMQIEQGHKQALSVEEMIDAYEFAQTTLAGGGYEEYLYNCFAPSEQHRFTAGMYGYGLEGETIGFGSGASSTIGCHYFLNEKENFGNYLAAPCNFDIVEPYDYTAVRILLDLIGNGLMTWDGLQFDRFRRISGCDFERVMELPGVRGWFRYLANCGAEFQWKDDRVMIDKALIPRVYITHLHYSNNPYIRQETGVRPDGPLTTICNAAGGTENLN